MNYRIYQHILTNNDTSETKILEVSVMDWADLTINHFRHELYGTVLFEEALSQRFPRVGSESEDKGGYYFLISAYELKGVKADVTYIRKVLDGGTNDYVSDFTGKIDFSSDSGWVIDDQLGFVDVKIIDSRKLAKFLSRDETEVNVFDLVSIDGVTMPDFSSPYQQGLWKPVDLNLKIQTDGFFSGTDSTTGSSLTFYTIYNGNLIENEPGDRTLINFPAVDEKIYKNNLDYEVFFKCTILSGESNTTLTITNIPSSQVWTFRNTIIFRIYDEADVLQDTISQIIHTDTGTGPVIDEQLIQSYSFAFLEKTIQSGWYITMQSEIRIVSGGGSANISANSSTDVDNGIFNERTEGEVDSFVRGFYAHEMASRLMQSTTSETDVNKLIYAPILGKTDSEFITYATNGFFARYFNTNGYQLRELTDRAINASFRDWFKSYKAIKPIGLWFDKINDYFVIDEIEAFYKSELAGVHLGEVSKLKITPAKKWYYNNLLTGYPKTENEDFQGVNEFNTETNHSISIETKAKNDIRSKYRTATVDQELSRRLNKRNYASKDTKYDKNIYITKLNSSDETIQGEIADMDGFEGVEQYYNMTITPRQNQIRQQILVNSALFKDGTEEFKFIKSAKDTNVSYTDPEEGVSVNEFDDIPQLFEPLVYPEIYEFEAVYTKEVRDEISNNPHAIYPFYDKKGNELYGYIFPNIEGKPYKQTAKYSLIRVNPNRVP
jgi:hypothetical protein